MRVAIIGSFPPQGGISAYCLELARALSNLVSLVFVSFDKMYPEKLHSSGRINDETLLKNDDDEIEVHRILRWYNPFTWISQAILLKAEILHVQWWSWFLGPVYITIMIIFRLKKVPIVTTIHNVIPHEKSIISEIFQWIIVTLSDHIIVHSKNNYRSFSNIYNVPPKRVSIIPHGLLLSGFSGNDVPSEAKRVFSICPNEKTILFFGTIREYKGLRILIKATSKLSQVVPNVRLIIAGRPWGSSWKSYNDLIESLHLKKKIVSRLAYIRSDQVSLFFDAADIVVLPYLHFNSQSGVGLIALAKKKPVIVTNVGSLSELVYNDDYIIPPGDVDALFQSLSKAFTTPGELEKLKKETEIISKKHEWNNIAKMTLDVYRKITFENVD
jgi:glycosyltransferase involved in cell wall biosynthesis